MLIRIVPDMFVDEKYNCKTIADVKKEIFSTSKFVHKYPWRIAFKDKVICLGDYTVTTSEEFKLSLETVKLLIQKGTVNKKNEKVFDLSKVDQKIVSVALAEGFEISTEDRGVADFLEQEFGKKSICALELLNYWLKNSLLVWDDAFLPLIAEWETYGEPPQPQKAIKEFEALTKCKYPCSKKRK